MATERMGTGPLEIVSGYNRIKAMVNAIAALTNQPEAEIVDGYIRYMQGAVGELSPEMYARVVTYRVLDGRGVPERVQKEDGGG